MTAEPNPDGPMTLEEVLTLAFTLVRDGVAVFPIAIHPLADKPGRLGKRPLCDNGHHDAVADDQGAIDLFKGALERLRKGEAPGVGYVPASIGAVVFDGDQHEEGIDGRAHLDDVLHLPPYTPMYDTPTGNGRHIVLGKRDDAVITNASPWRGAGVDIRSDNGWCVAPGTRTPWGSWTYVPGKPKLGDTLALVPADVWGQLTDATTKTQQAKASTVTGSPVDLDGVPELLAERLADNGPTWVIAGSDGDPFGEETSDRSRVFMSLLQAVKSAGYTQAEAVTLMTPWCNAVGKYGTGDGDRVPAAVAGAWGKLYGSHDAAALPIGADGTLTDGQGRGLETLVFDTTPELRYLRDHARHSMVSPWALLGCTLATVLAYLEPTVQIPGFIGSPASLNFGAVLATPSGGGKTTAMDVAEDLLAETAQEVMRDGVDRVSPSSGEGLLTIFISTNSKGEQTQIRTRALSVVDEIGTLAAQAARQGSTLMGMLRSGLSGAGMSTHAGERSRQRTLRRRSYRWCIAVATQKRTAAVFLDPQGVDEGTPQRFTWWLSIDPLADEDAPPAGPNPFTGWSVPDVAPLVVYPDGVRAQVRKAHAARQRGEGDALDGHAMLARLKVAAGLALLHRSVSGGALTVTDELWAISGHVMAASDRVRGWLLAGLQEQQQEALKARERATLDARESAQDERVERAALVLARRVQKASEPLTRKQVKDAAGSRYGDLWRDALSLAIQHDWVEEIDIDGRGQAGHHYAPGSVTL